MPNDPGLQVQFRGMQYFPRRPTLREVFAQADPRRGLEGTANNRKRGAEEPAHSYEPRASDACDGLRALAVL